MPANNLKACNKCDFFQSNGHCRKYDDVANEIHYCYKVIIEEYFYK